MDGSNFTEGLEYIEEIHDNGDLDQVTFNCSCGFQFKCGIIDLDKHSIFCPKCKKESLVDPETGLYEYDCPKLDEYLGKQEEF